MIDYERTVWYGTEYLLAISGSVLPRALPLMILGGVIAGIVAARERPDNSMLNNLFGATYGMQLFSLVFGYLCIARINICYARYARSISCSSAPRARTCLCLPARIVACVG